MFSLYDLLAVHPNAYACLDNLSQESLNQKMIWLGHPAQAGAFIVTAGLGQGIAVLHGGLGDLLGDCQAFCTAASLDRAFKTVSQILQFTRGK